MRQQETSGSRGSSVLYSVHSTEHEHVRIARGRARGRPRADRWGAEVAGSQTGGAGEVNPSRTRSCDVRGHLRKNPCPTAAFVHVENVLSAFAHGRVRSMITPTRLGDVSLRIVEVTSRLHAQGAWTRHRRVDNHPAALDPALVSDSESPERAPCFFSFLLFFQWLSVWQVTFTSSVLSWEMLSQLTCLPFAKMLAKELKPSFLECVFWRFFFLRRILSRVFSPLPPQFLPSTHLGRC